MYYKYDNKRGVAWSSGQRWSLLLQGTEVRTPPTLTLLNGSTPSMLPNWNDMKRKWINMLCIQIKLVIIVKHVNVYWVIKAMKRCQIKKNKKNMATFLFLRNPVTILITDFTNTYHLNNDLIFVSLITNKSFFADDVIGQEISYIYKTYKPLP